MIAFVAPLGMPADQFVAVFQSVLVVPVHVVCARRATGIERKRKRIKNGRFAALRVLLPSAAQVRNYIPSNMHYIRRASKNP